MINTRILQSIQAYNHILSIFEARLEMKHLLKGIEHREFTYSKLREILMSEVQELDSEMNKDESVYKATKAIEEALDVMIASMLIADRILGGFKE